MPATGTDAWPLPVARRPGHNDRVIRRSKRAPGDEISVPGLAIGLVVLVPGAILLGLLPFISAIDRMGFPKTTVFLAGIAVASVAFFLAYERLKPSSPPTPRRDAVIIVFSALVIGLWAFAFSNEMIAILVLAALAAVMLLPEDWGDWVADRLPHR
jgi:hypothetical protein